MVLLLTILYPAISKVGWYIAPRDASLFQRLRLAWYIPQQHKA